MGNRGTTFSWSSETASTKKTYKGLTQESNVTLRKEGEKWVGEKKDFKDGVIHVTPLKFNFNGETPCYNTDCLERWMDEFPFDSGKLVMAKHYMTNKACIDPKKANKIATKIESAKEREEFYKAMLECIAK